MGGILYVPSFQPCMYMLHINTSGTKSPLFVLKPMASLGTTSKFKKEGKKRLECSSVYKCMLKVREKEMKSKDKK